MSPPLIIRSATATDADAIASLAGELGYPVTGEVMRERLAVATQDAHQLAVVAVAEGDIPVGWLQAQFSCVLDAGRRVEILGLVVSARVRRSGAGRALVEAAERWAQRLGAETIVVRSRIERTESHRFYPALGYRETKTQKVYLKPLTEGRAT